MVSLLGFQYLLNLLHLCKICLLVSIRYMLHRHEKSSLGKNLRQYLLISTWLTIALVALAHNKLEWPNCCNQGLPLIFNGSIGLRLLSSNSRKFLLLRSATWNDILHCWEDRIAFPLFTKVPRRFVWENRDRVKTLGVFVY